MSDELKFPGAGNKAAEDSLGEPLVSLLREAYTPPDAAAWPDMYWRGLETRIMARVAAEGERSWWAELIPWARTGLVAAAVIFVLAGVVNSQLDAGEQVAYEAVEQPDLTFASDEPIAGQYVSNDNEASALRYFLSN